MPIANSSLNQLIHPTLLNSLPFPFPAVVNIQTADESQNADGQIVDTWEDNEDMKGLKCQLVSVGGNEQRKLDLTVATATHVLEIKSYQPLINEEDRAVVVTAVSGGHMLIFDIKAVRHDSQQTMTRLEMEIVNT